MESRKRKATRNIAFGLVGQLITMAMSFVSRTVFLYCFTKEYAGLVSLFSGIFSFLTLADLGMEASLTVKLYHPLASNDYVRIKALLGYYRKVFLVIAAVIFSVGLALLPFLGVLVDLPDNIPNINLIYVLSLLNSSVSYIFIYKKILFIADQKKYVTDVIQYIVTFCEYAVLIPLLLITHSYILYLIVQCCFKLLYNFCVMLHAKKQYRNVENAKNCSLDKASKSSIRSDMGAISFHRVGDVINANSWSLLVSACVSLTVAGLYSNYQLIITYVKVMMDKVYYAISPSVGNLIATESDDRVNLIFERMLFVSFVMSCICGNCLLCLLTPFIKIWLGNTFLLPFEVVLISVINFYIVSMRKPVLIFKEAYGFFKQDKYRPIIESGISVLSSLYLCKKMGLGVSGILMGISISYFLTTFWIEPYILYGKGLHKNVRIYFTTYFSYVVSSVAIMSISAIISSFIKQNIIGFLFTGFICVAIPFVAIICIYYRTEVCQWYISALLDTGRAVKKIIKRKLNLA